MNESHGPLKRAFEQKIPATAVARLPIEAMLIRIRMWVKSGFHSTLAPCDE